MSPPASQTKRKPKLRLVTALAPPTNLSTNASKVAEYAQQLQDDANSVKVRGVIVFEDRGDSVKIVEIGSCNPLPSRMLLGLARFVNREIIGF